MAAWLLAAMSLLTALSGPGNLLARIPGTTGFGGGAPALIPGMGLLPGEEKKRRRRRRALTASDRADIAFIESILGKAAGKSFAMIIATRT